MIAVADMQQGTTTDSAASGTTAAVPYPSGGRAIRSDDYLLMFLAQNNATVMPGQTGFTTHFSLSGTANTAVPDAACYGKKAAGGETGTFSATIQVGVWFGKMVAVPGVDLFNPMDTAPVTTDDTVSDTSMAFNVLTVVQYQSLVFCFGTTNTNTQTATLNAGYTEIAEGGTNRSGNVSYLQRDAGGTGPTQTWSGAGKGVGGLVSLRAAPPRAGTLVCV